MLLAQASAEYVRVTKPDKRHAICELYTGELRGDLGARPNTATNGRKRSKNLHRPSD